MSYLFHIEGNRVYPNPETLLTPPFKEIWDRDKSAGKEQALKELSFIEFNVSKMKTNPYAGYRDDERYSILCKDIMNNEKYKPDKLILSGLKALDEFQQNGSVLMSLYKASLIAKEALEDTLLNAKTYLGKTTGQGSAFWKPKDVTGALLDIDKVTNSLFSLHEKIQSELMSNTKVRGGKVISPFADPDFT